jgi:predicted amidohydrolase
MKPISITLVQPNIHWEDSVKNIKLYNKLLSGIKKGGTDLIILPEMFSTGFSMKPALLAEEMNGFSMQWMHETAASLKSVVCGSLIIKEKNKYFNRFIWMQPNGEYQHYDKRHLFRMGGEDKIYTSGKKKIVIPFKGWNICPFICYDLRFPIWSRNKTKTSGALEYDLAIYVANWPAVRSFPWQQLLIARAIENQAYVVGLNRVGEDGNGMAHDGHSSIIDMTGHSVQRMKPKKQMVETITLNKQSLIDFRKKFPAFKDADKFTVI